MKNAMIQPNEIRVGNIITCLGTKYIDNCLILDPEQITVTFENIADIFKNPKAFEGIPLTPDIFRKCTCNDIYKLHIPASDVDVVFWIENKYFIVLKTLHQFQNLYFALTGTELKYTP